MLALAVLVAAIGFYRWYNQTPPALESAGPGTVRLSASSASGVPALPHTVTLGDGSTVSLQYADTEMDNGRPVASVAVSLPVDDSPSPAAPRASVPTACSTSCPTTRW